MKFCPQCQSVFDGRKWTQTHQLSPKKLAALEHTLCTACKRVRDKVALGTVHLDGDVITSRSHEIMRMIKREVAIEQTRNHCSRIVDVRRDGNRMTIQTVNSLLAIHIARQFKRAFRGRMEIFKDTPGHRPRNKQTEGTVSVKWTQNPQQK
jgi:hypothetical protein